MAIASHLADVRRADEAERDAEVWRREEVLGEIIDDELTPAPDLPRLPGRSHERARRR